MKALLTCFGMMSLMIACNPVTVPVSGRSENFNYKQAKTIIESQKKYRKKELRTATKNRKKELAVSRNSSKK